MRKEKNRGPSRPLGHLAGFAAAILWAVSYTLSVKLLDVCTFTQMIAIQFTLGYIVLLVISPHLLKTGSVRAEMRYAVTGILGLTAFYALCGYSVTYNTSEATLTAICCVPVVSSVALCVSGKKDSLNYLYGIAFLVAMTGVVLVLINEDGSLLMNVNTDIILVLAGACLCRGMYNSLSDSHGEGNAAGRARRAMFWAMLSSIALMFMTDGLPEAEPILRASSIIYLLITGLLGCGVAYLLYQFSIKRIGSERASGYTYIIPSVCLALSTFVFNSGEFSMMAVIGSAVAFIGLLMSAFAY